MIFWANCYRIDGISLSNYLIASIVLYRTEEIHRKLVIKLMYMILDIKDMEKRCTYILVLCQPFDIHIIDPYMRAGN